MTLETMEVVKPKVKKKHNWMLGFQLTKPLDDLAKAQLENRNKIVNDFKKTKRR